MNNKDKEELESVSREQAEIVSRNLTFDTQCPHCAKEIAVSAGITKCPNCHKPIDLKIRFD